MMQAFENEEGKLIVRGGMTVNNQGKISGFVNTNDGTLSQTDFIADFFRIGTMNGENFEPVFGLDAVSRKLVLKGRLILDDGSLISNKDELQGKDGTIWGTLKLRDGIFPSDALATADFTARYGRAPILDDMLTYVSNDGSVSSTKSYNGTAWVAPALRFSGDLITPGTIFGDRFVAGSELTAPVIKGGEAYFGKEVGAPFDGYHTKISQDGLIQTDRIQATSGNIDNVTIGEDCDILGTLTAGQIVGDVVRVSVANVTQDKFATANRPASGNAVGYETVATVDIGQASWSRTVVVPNGIIFDNFNSLAGIQYVVDGVVYHQHDTTNLNSYQFDGKHATYAGQFIVPPGTSGVITIRLFTEIAFNAPFDYSRGYIYAGTSFVLTNFKSS